MTGVTKIRSIQLARQGGAKDPNDMERAGILLDALKAAEREAETEDTPDPWPPARSDLAATAEEVSAAQLAPECVVHNYLYSDVAQLVAPGGTGKTTMLLHEAICIAIGRPVWGLDVVTSGWTLVLTKEDQRERLLARLREIMTAMELSDAERDTVMRCVVILDVTGSDRKLLFVTDGNIKRTELATQIINAYRDDPPKQIIIDPTVSFGASEAMVNDNEQALVEVARYIVRELNCCVRYVHHTGKAQARAAQSDQYSGRGGSALADGSRMTAVLESWDGKETPPAGCSTAPPASVIKLCRHKVSYAPPNQPTIWIRREGFGYASFVELQRTPEEVLDAETDQVERYIASRLSAGEHHTMRSLEAQKDLMSLTRQQVRTAVETLMARGRVTEKPMPTDKRRGQRKTYLHPAIAPEPKNGLAQ